MNKHFLALTIICFAIAQALAFTNSPKVDPVRFKLTTTAAHIAVGEEFEIKITASYQQISPNLV